MSKRYISYFTSVMTVGMVSESESATEAHRKASSLLGGDRKIDCCYFDQSEFRLRETEPWTPEFEVKNNCTAGLDFRFDPSKRTKRVIALMLGKEPEELETKDYETFVKNSIQASLDSSEEPS